VIPAGTGDDLGEFELRKGTSMYTTGRGLVCLAAIVAGLWSSVAPAGKPELTHTRLFENHKT